MSIKRLLYLYAIGFGLGLSPVMPGTCGSFLAVLMALPLYQQSLAWPIYLLLLVSAYFAADVAGKRLKNHDHKSIVCDEVVGLLPVLLLVSKIYWPLAFFLFRVLDIYKPWPISWCDQNIPDAKGCLSDDLLAGFFSWVLLQAVI